MRSVKVVPMRVQKVSTIQCSMSREVIFPYVAGVVEEERDAVHRQKVDKRGNRRLRRWYSASRRRTPCRSRRGRHKINLRSREVLWSLEEVTIYFLFALSMLYSSLTQPA